MNEPVDPHEPKFAAGGEVEAGRFVFADTDHGCTLFIPRAGDPKRSAAILEHVRQWYRGEATS